MTEYIFLLSICKRCFPTLKFTETGIFHIIKFNFYSFYIFIELCNHHYYLISEQFYHSKNKPHILSSTLPIAPPPVLGHHLIYFVSTGLPILDMS